MKQKVHNILLTTFFALLIYNFSFATHIAGGYINYECTGNPNEYLITITLYRDCSGQAAPTELSDIEEVDPFFGLPLGPAQLQFENDCGLSGPAPNGQCGGGIFGGGSACFKMDLVSSQEVSQLCASDIGNSSCNGGSLPGYEEYVYQAIVVLPECSNWKLTYELCCRNPATNVQNADDASFVIEAVIDTQQNNCNTTPTITAAPQPYVCVGQNVSYGLGAFEPDGHNLEYELVGAYASPGNQVNYNAGYGAQNPIQNITIDQNTGVLQYTPTLLGNFIIVVKINEYDDDGNFLSFTYYDFQTNVIECINEAPDPNEIGIYNVNGSAQQSGPNQIGLCSGESVCFDVEFSDPDENDVLTVTSNLNDVFPNGTVTYTGTNPVVATVCFESGSEEVTNSITFLIQDDACPIVGQNNYTITVTSGQNCCSLTVDAGSNVQACIDQAIQLAGSFDNEEGNTTVVWNASPAAALDDLDQTNVLDPIFTPSQAYGDVVFTLSVTDDGPVDGACTITSQVTVTVSSLPQLSSNPICPGEDAVFTFNGDSGMTITYSLNDGATTESITLDGNGFGEVVIPTPTEDQIISVVEVVDGSCTIDPTDLRDTVFVFTISDFDVTPAECGLANGSVEALVPSSDQQVSYTWSGPGSGSQNTSTENPWDNLPSGWYYVVVEYNNCSVSDSVFIAQNDPPIADFTATPMVGNIPLNVNFTNTSNGGISFEWDFGNGEVELVNDFSDQSTVYTEEGEYTVLLTVIDGECTDTISKVIVVTDLLAVEYDMPNIFTPNGDGINDVFTINAVNALSLEMVILSRWGNVVFESNSVNAAWNGKVNNDGGDCSEGTYFYKFKLVGEDGQEIEEHGYVQLVRQNSSNNNQNPTGN